jgi:NhaP-type Na+/H+ or K+/H+ antiporter
MWDPNAETLTFLVFALVLGTVVFGGTTLAYFLDKGRRDPPRR